MASTYVNDLRLEEITTGEQAGTWGDTTNRNLELIAEAFGYGEEVLASASTMNITLSDGVSDNFRSLYLKLTGGDQDIVVTLKPETVSKVWVVYNSSSYQVTLRSGSSSGGDQVIIAAGATKMVVTDGGGSSSGKVIDALTNLSIDPTISTALLPDTSGGADIGSTSAEFGHVYIADNKNIQFGSDQDVTVGYETTDTNSLKIAAKDGAGLAVTLMADNGDDAGDEWKLNIADGGTLTFGNDKNTAGTHVTHLTLTPNSTVASSTLALAGNVTAAGAATVTGQVAGGSFKVENGDNDWTVTVSSNNLLFSYGGTAKMKLDSSGNLTVTGNVTAYGSI